MRSGFCRAQLSPTVLIILVLGILPLSIRAQDRTGQAASPPALPAQVDQLLRPVSAGKCPGVAIGVVRDGRPILMKGYGLADVEKGLPITSATIFRIGSVTKSFTSLAVLQLVERGKLRLDDPLALYLPDFPRAGEIRIRHLLSHTAGVPDFVSYEQARKLPLEFTPGTRINYSNTGYNVLGRIIEKVSGQKYAEYLRAHIFQPAGMTHSGYDTTADLPGRARGYLLDDKGAYLPIPPGDVAEAFAAGGLYSNIEDLVRWEEALEQGTLVKKQILDEASTPYQLADGRRTGYGFGFMTGRQRGLREVGHGGDIDGFNAYLARYPDQHFAVIVLSNTGMRPPGRVPEAGVLAHRIAEIYLGEFMAKPEAPRVVQVAPATLDTYVGRYEIEAAGPIVAAMGKYLTITRDGDHLVGEGKMGKMPLTASSPTTFSAPGSPAEITFVRDAQGKVSGMTINLMGLREFPAHRLD